VIATGNDEQSRQIAQLIGQFIVNAANHSPRSLQTAIGPSEIGEPCERKLSYKLAAWPATAGEREPIAPVIGTGFHAWMEEQFTARNAAGRYKIEERVTVRDSPIETARISGSSDLYDRVTCTNYDWKLVGKSSLEKYRSKGPGPQYRVQAHLYGLGQENAGETPRRVAIVFVGRYHELIIHVWSEPYDRQVALDALDRLDRIRQRFQELEPEANPAAWAEIPIAEDAKCRFCDWLLPGSTDLSKGCPGIQAGRTGYEGLLP
jgi:hypothetical protein